MNKEAVTEQILNLIVTAENAVQLNHALYFIENAAQLEKNLNLINSSFCGSWQGYHANVYYKDLKAPPAGDSFSPEWGLINLYGSRNIGGWRETHYNDVEAAVLQNIDSEYLIKFGKVSQLAEVAYNDAFGSLTTLLAVLIESKASSMLEEIQKEVSEITGVLTKAQVIDHMSPKGAFMTRDSKAMTQGTRVPPHIDIETKLLSMRSPFVGLSHIIRLSRKLHKYMVMQDLIEVGSSQTGEKIFIAHGQSLLWRELQDFLQNRLHLPWDEFNRESAAGLATTERLWAMLDDACFAFLIFTAEDTHEDTLLHARENVIHETGLFQGKLGFRRAIILLEKGCSEFSNIIGLTQIRFPKGNISAIFEEARCVLERENILNG